MEITRQVKPEVAETVRFGTADFNPFRSVVHLNEALIGTVCMDNSFWIQVGSQGNIQLKKKLKKIKKTENKPL